MPKFVHKLPVPRLHRPSGRARIRLNGIDHWLGKFGSPHARQKYDELIATWLSNGRQLSSPVPALSPLSPPPPAPAAPPTQERHLEAPSGLPAAITVGDLIARFSDWSERYYRHPDGTPTREHQNFLAVLNPLGKSYWDLPVQDFGPSRLLQYRESLIRKKLARRTINVMLRRLRQVFRWGVSREMIDVSLYQRLQTVESLQPNRGGRETSGSRGSVSWELVERTLPFLPELIGSLVVVAFHTGARIGELSRLTTGMIDTTTDPWIADLSEHKTAHRGKSKRIYFGPRARAALERWILPDQPDAVIFSPRRVDDRQEKRRGKRLPGQVYSRCGLSTCLKRAIKRAGVEKWTLGQLRHSAACRITDSFDLETTRQILGHSQVSMSRHYSQDADHAGREAAKKIG